jgi:hypothetical protein
MTGWIEEETNMRHLSESEGTQMMALGYVSELYEDPDGNLYGWIEGVDERGNPIGSCQGLSQPEVSALSGLGALYEAPDGTMYHVQGLADEEAADAKAESAEPEQSAESEAPPATESGEPSRPRPFQRRRPIAWGRRRPLYFRHRRPVARPGGPGVRRGRPGRGGFFKKLLPVAKLASRFIPIPGAGAAVRAGLTLASKLGTRKGVGGLGALYAAPDGTVYQVQGLAEQELEGPYEEQAVHGFAEDEELRGLAQDEELRGFGQEEELHGFAEEEELRGVGQEELQGVAQNEELQGLDQGYVREDTVSGMEAYVPAEPAKTRWFTEPDEPPELWKPLW